MKRTMLISLLLGFAVPAYADQAADAFATAFANSLNQSLYGQQNTNNVQQINVQQQPLRTYVATPGHPLKHYDAVNDSGTPAGMIFGTFSGCMRYVNRSRGTWVDCIPAE